VECGEPADCNIWRRMKEAGVRIGFLDKVVGKHYLEGMQRKMVRKGESRNGAYAI